MSAESKFPDHTNTSQSRDGGISPKSFQRVKFKEGQVIMKLPNLIIIKSVVSVKQSKISLTEWGR